MGLFKKEKAVKKGIVVQVTEEEFDSLVHLMM